ncbi:thioredoxin M1, chloroplastic-like [Typha latifolia]|uniref:thioredoxin M1, chloroplastic-like n=1 Tax=Typha latifolia TaxID=4733 RepID=UPI003C2EE384
MANVLDSLMAPSSRSALATVSVPRAALTPSSSLLRCGVSPLLPEFKGLRLVSRAPPAASARAGGSVKAIRHGTVVCEAQETAIQVPDVTKSTWQSLVLDSDIPVLVEFWASWCGPCRMIDPVIGKLSKTYEGKLKCYKLNTDENPDIATQHGIRSIPTMMIFVNGEKKEQVIGAVPESTLISSIEKIVGR